MAKEYIERGALLRKLRYISKTYGLSDVVIRRLKKAIDDSLAADVVEVVRCKDCKHAKMYNDILGEPHLFCCNGKSIYRRKVDFDDFCSEGERKDNG